MLRDSPLFRGFAGVTAASLLFLGLLLMQASAKDRKVDFIVVQKAQRTLQLMSNGSVLRSYTVRLGSQPLGDKQQEGDGRTPEGHYVIVARNERSAFPCH